MRAANVLENVPDVQISKSQSAKQDRPIVIISTTLAKMELVYLSLLFIVLLVCCNGKMVAAVGKPRVYVHIGPSKTGTTHIQDVFSRIKDDLPSRGVCWPAKDNRDTYFHPFADALDAHNEAIIRSYRDGIDKCLAKGLTVIISSEHFHFMADVNAFYEFFKTYDTYIIAFHREVTTWLYSEFTQRNKIKVNPGAFGEHIVAHNSLFNNGSSSREDIRKFVELFGREKMVFVDYDGAMAAGKDIAYVIMCDILGIYCSHLPKVLHSQSNARPEMVPFNVMSILTHFVQVLGCSVCRKVSGKNMQDFVKRFDPLPQTKVDHVLLPGLWELSDQEEESYLLEFGDLMLYSNRTASRNVARSFSVMELDQEAFYNNRQNGKWLRGQAVSLHRDGALCNCPENIESLLRLL